MKRALLFLVVALGLSITTPAQARAQVAGPSAVTEWIDLELSTIASHRVNPPRASRELAHLSGAMYLAALAGGNSRDDAVAGAAATVLTYFHADEAARIDALAGSARRQDEPCVPRRKADRKPAREARAERRRRRGVAGRDRAEGGSHSGSRLRRDSCTRRSSRSPAPGGRGTSERDRSFAPARRLPTAAHSSWPR